MEIKKNPENLAHLLNGINDVAGKTDEIPKVIATLVSNTNAYMKEIRELSLRIKQIDIEKANLINAANDRRSRSEENLNTIWESIEDKAKYIEIGRVKIAKEKEAEKSEETK